MLHLLLLFLIHLLLLLLFTFSNFSYFVYSPVSHFFSILNHKFVSSFQKETNNNSHNISKYNMLCPLILSFYIVVLVIILFFFHFSSSFFLSSFDFLFCPFYSKFNYKSAIFINPLKWNFKASINVIYTNYNNNINNNIGKKTKRRNKTTTTTITTKN